MLTLYILKTHHGASVTPLLDSLDGLYDKAVTVERTHEINEAEKDCDWFVVFFDNEIVSPDLKDAMLKIMEIETDIDCFIFMEKYPDGRIFQAPRMFKKHVELGAHGFMPTDQSLKFERILDGWIYKDV